MGTKTSLQNTLGHVNIQGGFGKSCHLQVEIEHKSFWAMKKCNLDKEKAGSQGN